MGQIQDAIQQTAQATGVAAAKVAPAAGGVAWYQHTLNEWVAIVTIGYVVLQAGLLIPAYFKLIKKLFKKKK